MIPYFEKTEQSNLAVIRNEAMKEHWDGLNV